MAHVDDPGYDEFVQDIMNTTMSSAYNMDLSDDEDELLHNVSDDNLTDDGQSESEDIPPYVPTPTQLATPIDGWNNVTDMDPGPSKTIPIFNINKGTNLPTSFDSETEPVEYFYLFFDEDIRNFICQETNLFASMKKNKNNSPNSRIKHWKNIDDKDVKAFLGVIINMGIMPLPTIDSYFMTKWESNIPFYSDVFSQRDFLNIFWNLHFNHDNNPVSRRPKGFLINPLIEHIKNKCKLFYTPGNYVSVDESTISFKGKISFRVYNPQKPNKFGMKVFVLSDSENGYMYDFLPYFGKEILIPNSPLLKTTQIVKLLTDSLVYSDPHNPISALHVYTDRYYTSPQLATELLSTNCFLTGTVMPHRSGLPKDLKNQSKKLKKGEILSQRKGDILVTCWRDKRVVVMLSTNSKGDTNNMTSVPSKWPNKPPTQKPNVIIDYIKHMGGVDRSDHYISSYQFLRRTKKWYRKYFFWLLEVAIINSYLLYKSVQLKEAKKPLSHIEFRRCLVRSLVAERVTNKQTQKRKGRPIEGPPEKRLQGKHFLNKRDKKKSRCVVCAKKGVRSETCYVCKTCPGEPAMHPENCFEDYHTKKIY